MGNKFQTQPHRLPDECYRGLITAAFTCCIKDKKQDIARAEIVLPCSEILFTESIQSDCDVLAYIFMLDHCHILLQGKSEHADTLSALRNFKQKSGYWLSKNYHGIEWQKSFYDHILRSDEEIDKHMRYILENPVRKEIIEDLKEYPWKGSSVYDLNEWCP
jgi:REP element-mobilizing transposase RayT